MSEYDTFFVFFIAIVLVETLIAQDVRIVDAKIVDESNGQNLPYATVYIALTKGQYPIKKESFQYLFCQRII